MKKQLAEMIALAAEKAGEDGKLSKGEIPAPVLEKPKFEEQGDFSTNIAMVLASREKMPPRKVAEAIVAHLQDPGNLLRRVEVAGPGFINFFLHDEVWLKTLAGVHENGPRFGSSNIGAGRRVMVEFVSANPTGPLHVGHGRGAALGDAIASHLAFSGFLVDKEYYINDSGRQIRTLGRSVYVRCLQASGKDVPFPEDHYRGDYIRDLAASALEKKPDLLSGMDEEEAVAWCARFAADDILEGIRADLADFGVSFEHWFSEQGLYDSGKVEDSIGFFRDQGLVYESEGALWFKTSAYGDEKDRVVVRQNGLTTYFASDIAYHKNKFERGYDWCVDVWGADHHGYVGRVEAAVEACGYGRERFKAVLVYLVNLLRAGVPVAMSTRSGEFVTLKEVVDEVGRDAARFLFLTRHHESPLDFDLEVAKKKSDENPVYYVQYVHARISSMEKKAAEKGMTSDEAARKSLSLLKEPEELRLMKKMGEFPEVVELGARLLEPHRTTFFLKDLASLFHTYYNKHRVVGDDQELSLARLYLARAVKQVIHNGLTLLGVSAPEQM